MLKKCLLFALALIGVSSQPLLSYANETAVGGPLISSTESIPQISQVQESEAVVESTEEVTENTEVQSTMSTDESAVQTDVEQSATQTSPEGTEESESAATRAVVAAPVLTYRTHVSDVGWLSYVGDGASSGTVGQAKRLEAIQLKVDTGGRSGGIEYVTHIENLGWETAYRTNDQVSGTSGRALRLEAIRIRLTGELSEQYDVYYRVHSQNFGWLDWAKNDEQAGTQGFAYRLEAIEVKLVKKGAAAPGATTRTFYQYKSPNLSYQAHVQEIGWQSPVSNGATAGTSGMRYRVEALKTTLTNLPEGMTGGIQYRSHVQDIGWQGFVADGALSGTTGQRKQIEAVQIGLTGEAAKHFEIYYRVHSAEFGWLGWTKNGGYAGTSGGNKRMEAIQIKLVRMDAAGPALGRSYLAGNDALTAGEKEAAQIAYRRAHPPYYYSQLDRQWSGMTFGMSQLGPSGCVPTSMAMVLRGAYGANVTPVDTARRIYSYGGYNQQYFGASGADLVRGLGSYGRGVAKITSVNQLNDYLNKGYPVIMFVNVGIGHAVVTHGYSDGKTNVYDPYGRQFYNGWVSTSQLWNTPSKDSIDWNAGRPYFAIL